MAFRLALPIAAALSFAACSSAPPTEYHRPTPSQAVQSSQQAVDTPTWMQTPDYAQGGPIPPMEDKRAINEQSCTEDINLTAGNLRCK